MAHVTGIVNNLADLVTAIRAACTANGWTLAGEVLIRDDVYVRTQVVGDTVTFLGGTGIDGSNLLTGAGPAVARMSAFAQALTFPMTYEVHINTAPDEVYVVINYNVDFFQWAAWGQSAVEGLPGAGVWYAATGHNGGSFAVSINANPNSVSGRTVPALFAMTAASGLPNTTQNGFVQHGLDGESWNPVIASGSAGLLGYASIGPLLGLLPNTWNSETVLLPAQAWRARSSGNKVSLVADLQHFRHCRIDFHDPGDIITLGSDEWKLYPCYRKDVVNRDGGNDVQHSGTFGFAVRYTGA